MDRKHQYSQLSKWSVVATLIIIVMAAGSVHGQDVANGQATATVLAVLSVTATQALQFGNVYQGVAKTQDETDDALSGIFDIVGATRFGAHRFAAVPCT